VATVEPPQRRSPAILAKTTAAAYGLAQITNYFLTKGLRFECSLRIAVTAAALKQAGPRAAIAARGQLRKNGAALLTAFSFLLR
jgi:hypothetical protein